MATQTTVAAELAADDLVTLGAHTAGLLNAAQSLSAAQLALGRKFLYLSLESLQSQGIILRARERYSFTTTASRSYVDAPADTLSIEGTGAVAINADGTETTIQPYTLEQYQAVPDKTIEGRPSFYFAEQRAVGGWRVHLYLVPTSDWPTVVIPRTRRLLGAETGEVTLDLEPRWHLPVTLWMAARWSFHYGRIERYGALLEEFGNARDDAMDNETERGPGMFVVEPLEFC